jgi:hypothetical protein
MCSHDCSTVVTSASRTADWVELTQIGPSGASLVGEKGREDTRICPSMCGDNPRLGSIVDGKAAICPNQEGVGPYVWCYLPRKR